MSAARCARQEPPPQFNGFKRKHSVDLEKSLVEEVKALLTDEECLHLYDDLTKVNPVTPEIVLKCLQARYTADVFYTNAGCTVVAVNPFQPVDKLYSVEIMKEYHTASHPQNSKPHIFTVAEQAYRNVQNRINPINQSIIVTGESGAGKTWTTRCLMKFYTAVAPPSILQGSHKMLERIESRVLDSNPVLEAFGNACTLRNNNSSRFGKYIQLQLNSLQQITGASIQTYLLESTRIAHQNVSERNFHIFYQIVKGASQHEREHWDLPEDVKFSWLPHSEKLLEEDCFESTKTAMLHLGIELSAQNNIFKILSGLLHMGNLHFSESLDESQACEILTAAKEFVNSASNLLKLPPDLLLERLCFRTITAGKQVFKKPCKKSECETRRDCLAKTIYARLFDWLVSAINESICSESGRWKHFIGLLDVYGFESFPQNSLEQLCINYANEKLQQHFVSHYMKAQQDEYASEGLEWSFISYQDNKRCVELIEGNPVSIFSLLNEECRLNRPSDALQLQSRLEVNLSQSMCFGRDKFSKSPNFVISHYAGKVTYQIEEMSEKNKDPVPPELIQLLHETKDRLLQKVFPIVTNHVDVGAHNRISAVTVVSKFKGSLENLMNILHETTPHYIRCIKPNMDCKAMVFRNEEVLSQLEACGIVETIHISAAGFPIRISFQSFVKRYEIITPFKHIMEKKQMRKNSASHGIPLVVDGDELRLKSQNILHMVLSKLYPSSNTLAHCGTTKVFLTHFMVDLLEKRRARALSERALTIQCCWRQYTHRKLSRQRIAAITIQAVVRSWLTRKHIEKIKKAASIIKRAWIKWKKRMEVLSAHELDDILDIMESPTLSVEQKANGSSDKNYAQSKPLEYCFVAQSWIFGFALFRAPPVRNMGVTDGFNRHLQLLVCLHTLNRRNGYSVKANQSERGITSIRALPQGSVKFHYKRSPLQFASVCPDALNCGFNGILLEKVK
ncbi:unconventional myosin-XIX isoform X1 [Phyllobates terribilis]|uniref:unconventional myosin-XIX isoform X1 n=1 Tax=Phyllobates terribilis TaxID=111132 RepID=UPI003CCB62EE